MFIAHLPSGYLLSVSLLRRMRHIPATANTVILTGMLGALAPDFDLAYFQFIDHRQTHHHQYLTHWPLLWLTLTAAAGLWWRLARQSRAAFLSLVFGLGCVLHVILDSFVGDIWWLAPFVNRPFALFTVPAVYSPWWVNFILHWSFAVELVICGWALHLYRLRRLAHA